jgi:multidrug resistance efflux pump
VFDIPRIRNVFAGVWRPATFVLAATIVVVLAKQWNRWEGAAPRQTTDDAYLQADLTPISAKVPGYVSSVPVQDYQRVHAGQVIAQIVDDDYRAAVAQSEANVALAEAQIQTFEAQRTLQQANIQAAQAVLAATGRKPVTDWVFDDLLDMSYEVDLFGRVRRSIEAARTNAGAVAAARDTLKVTVAAETARAYAEVCTLGEEIAVAEHSLEDEVSVFKALGGGWNGNGQ